VVASASTTPADAPRLELKLDERTVSAIGQREMSGREMLARGLRVSVVNTAEPARLALFAATLRDGIVASVWWSPSFRAAPGMSRLPGAQYLPEDLHLSGNQYLQGALHLPGKQYLQGALHLPGNQYLQGALHDPVVKYSPSLGYGTTLPGASIVPVSVAEMAETGVVHGRRIDWRRQQVLYLTLVPVDSSGAASRTLGVAFAMPMPDR
jgi:hypothetical protein